MSEDMKLNPNQKRLLQEVKRNLKKIIEEAPKEPGIGELELSFSDNSKNRYICPFVDPKDKSKIRFPESFLKVIVRDHEEDIVKTGVNFMAYHEIGHVLQDKLEHKETLREKNSIFSIPKFANLYAISRTISEEGLDGLKSDLILPRFITPTSGETGMTQHSYIEKIENKEDLKDCLDKYPRLDETFVDGLYQAVLDWKKQVKWQMEKIEQAHNRTLYLYFL